MKWKPDDQEVEALLRPEARAGLPFPRLMLLYLHPFALFKDATRGPAHVKERAFSYNRSMRWMLLTYLRRWTALAASFFLAIAGIERLAAKPSILIIPAAAFGVLACVALTVTAWTLAAYVLLGARRAPGGRPRRRP
jgi:hypothetical protein